jgi:hypothetical protein
MTNNHHPNHSQYFIMIKYHLRMFPWTCSTTLTKATRSIIVHKNCRVTSPFSARFCSKESNE